MEPRVSVLELTHDLTPYWGTWESKQCVRNALGLGSAVHRSASSLEAWRGCVALNFTQFHHLLDMTGFSLSRVGRGANQSRRKANACTSWSFAVAESGDLPTWLGFHTGKSQRCLAPDPAPSLEALEWAAGFSVVFVLFCFCSTPGTSSPSCQFS